MTNRRRKRWLQRFTAEEMALAAQLMPWGKCKYCGRDTQWRVLQRKGGVPTGVEWFACESCLGV